MGDTRNVRLDDTIDVIAEMQLHELDEPEQLLPAWLSQRSFFWAPESLPRNELKLFTSRLVALIAAGSLHIGLAAIFLLYGHPWLVALNIGSLACFALAITITRRGRHRAGVLIGFMEVLLHVPVMTFLLGLDAGYLAYDLALGMVAMLVFSAAERALRYGLVMLSLASLVVLTLLAQSATPWLSLDPANVRLLGYLNVGSTVLALFFIMGAATAASDRAEKRIERERRRSEQLLLNILPQPIAERLKRDPGTIADAFQSVSVLFADVVGFTLLASRVGSTEVVEILNAVFTDFDRLANKHGLEKIKTIGDAYMVVGGLPEPQDDHAAAMAQMALDMHDAITSYAARTGHDLEIRVGIHTGPVVAGVIGVNKFAYDIWGDTVNTASRMESHGVAGRTQISDATKALIEGRFELEDRGYIKVKGKGEMRAWLLVSASTCLG